MSKILRRPMFRGGKVIDSRGTGITSGLMDGGRVGYKTGGDLLNRYNYFDPYALPGFSSVKRTMAIPNANVSAEKGGQQIGNTDYLVTRGYASDVEGPVEGMTMAELLDFQAGEKSDTYQTGKSGLDKKITGMTESGELITETVDGKPREVTSVADLTDDEKLDFRTKQMKATKGALEKTPTIPKIETPPPPENPNGNGEQKVEVSAKDLIRENAELFKELLNEGQKDRVKKARIGDASDYLLKFFEGSQKEGATVGSAAADVAGFATSKDSKTEKALAAKDKVDQTAVALAINDYVAGKRSKEDIQKAFAVAAGKAKMLQGNIAKRINEDAKGLPVTVSGIQKILREEGKPITVIPKDKTKEYQITKEDEGTFIVEEETKNVFEIVNGQKVQRY